MWVHISTKAKTIVLPHKFEVVILHKLYLTKKTSTIIVENTENLPYSSSYTIEYKTVRNSHLLSYKNWHFLKCHSNCSTNKCKLLMHKPSKQQLTAHTSIVKGNMTKCHKHAPFLFKCTIVFMGVKKSTDIIMQNTKQINLVYNNNYYKNRS